MILWIRYWPYCWSEDYKDCITFFELEKMTTSKIHSSSTIKWWTCQRVYHMIYNLAVYIFISSAVANIYYICSDEVFNNLAWFMLNQHILISTKLFLTNTSIYIINIMISLASSSAVSYSEILTFSKSFHKVIINGFIHFIFSEMACWYIIAILWRGDTYIFPLRFPRTFFNF